MTNYACTFPKCSKVFSKFCELMKHMATHYNPNSVFYCPYCDFFTLKKNRLEIHIGVHTGEKRYACPDMTTVPPSLPGLRPRQKPCDFKSNDPAALTRHRKSEHDYTPPCNRRRTTQAVIPASPRKPQSKKEASVSASPRKPRGALRMVNNSSVGPFSVESSQHPGTSTLPQGDAMDVDGEGDFDYGFGNEEMELDPHYDPSLDPRWMEMYEKSYAQFDTVGTQNTLQPAQVNLERSLYSDWMAQTGTGGWDQSTLNAHNDYYTFGAGPAPRRA